MINATEIKLWATMCHRDIPERTDVFYKSYESLCNLNVDKFKSRYQKHIDRNAAK